MMRKALGLAAALAVLSVITVVVAQSRRTQPPAVEQATRALVEGRYDQVQGLLEKLDQNDPVVSALIARADIARGKYQEAEARLRPIAQRAPTSDAALELGLLLKYQGKSDATAVLQRIAPIAATSNDATEMARGARALRALERFQESKSAYVDAETVAPRDPAINTALGDLWFEKYNKQEALKSYQAALRADAKWEPAMFGVMKTIADEDPAQAQAMAKKALEINPSDVNVHVFVAGEAADSGRRDEARKSVQKALEVNPNSIEAHALLAGLNYVEDKKPEFDAEVAKALAINPRSGEVYRKAGELAAHNYRFDEAVALVRRGLAIDPRNALALSDLGTHLLRTGDEPGARAALEQSLQIDPFDDVVRNNLLNMMDRLDTFATVRDGDLILKLSKDEAPLMTEPAIALAHQALDTMSKKYEFKPTGPILIEMFYKHDDFAVRNVGLPGMVGALGACFGRVVTLDSPKALPPGEFQWEATLWHELGHVITLQLSNQRVPRWLTEGISVHEERMQRPEWARGQDMQFAAMLNRKEALKLRDLNSGFTDARLISISYFEASLVVDHIVQTYGQAGLNTLLRVYGEGKDTETALKEALSTDLDKLQVGFDQYLDKNFGKLQAALQMPDEGTDLSKMSIDDLKAYAAAHPGMYGAHLMLGNALRKSGDIDGAIAAFEKASALVPIATGDQSPDAQIAAMALQKKDTARAIAAFQQIVAVDFDNVEAARKLAELMQQSGVTDAAKLRPIYQRIVAIDPYDVQAQSAVGRMSMQMNQPEAAIPAFKAVVALKPVDPATAHTDLAESYLRAGNRTEARRQTLAALEIAPSFERAQDLLLKLAEGRP